MLNNKNITVLITAKEFGGHERMLLYWIREAIKFNICNFEIYCGPNARLIYQIQNYGLETKILGYEFNKNKILNFVINLCITIKFLCGIKKNSIILIAPGVIQAGIVNYILIKITSHILIVYVPMAHSSEIIGLKFRYFRDIIIKKIVKKVDIWITITKKQKTFLERIWKIKKEILIIQNYFDGIDIALKKNFQNKKIRILYLGRFDEYQKGLDWYLFMIENKLVEQKNLIFRFQGVGSYIEAIKALQRKIGEERIEIFGWGSSTESYAESDILVLPSRYEGLPLVVLESSNFDLPIIATKQSNVDELVPIEFLVEFGDTVNFLKVLDKLIDPVTRKNLSAEIRVNIEEKITKQAFSDSIKNTLQYIRKYN